MEANNHNKLVNSSEAPLQSIYNSVNKQKSFFPIILCSLIILVAVGLGIYYLGTQNNIITNPTNMPVATQIPQTNETINWKTYTNTKFGYSFQYPPALSVSNCPNYGCGEIIYYPKASGKVEISEDNTLVSIALIGQQIDLNN